MIVILNAITRNGDAITGIYLKLMKNNKRIPFFITNKELYHDFKTI